MKIRIESGRSLSCPTGTLAMVATQTEASPKAIMSKAKQIYLLLAQIAHTLIVNITFQKGNVSGESYCDL